MLLCFEVPAVNLTRAHTLDLAQSPKGEAESVHLTAGTRFVFLTLSINLLPGNANESKMLCLCEKALSNNYMSQSLHVRFKNQLDI